MSFVAKSVVRGLAASSWATGPLKRASEPVAAVDVGSSSHSSRWESAPSAHTWTNHANVHEESTDTSSYKKRSSSDWSPAAAHGSPGAAQRWRSAASVGSGGPSWSHHTTEGSISPQARNGASPYGTSKASTLPSSLDSPGWGDAPVVAAPVMPDTGVTRMYEFTMTYDTYAPDGVEKMGILINDQFPGPTIEANWGDWIQVTVNNQLENEGTSVHWHGLLQSDTQWMDGVPGVAQCPIPPGRNFTYLFRADLYGTSWYHSHYSAQYVGGSVGPMIIYGPNTTDYDIDLGPIMIQDWYHSPYYSLVEQTMAPISAGLSPVQSDNILIAGHGSFNCSATTLPCTPNAGIAKFQFQSGKTHRLRLMNTGAESILKFSIDGHTMSVIANDFVPIVPYDATSVTLGVGQRTDVLVTASGSPTDAVYMRANAGPGYLNHGCNINNPDANQALAIIYYEEADSTAIPTSSPQDDYELTRCSNDALNMTTPLQVIPAVYEASTTQEIHITYKSNGTHNLFYMGEETYRADYNDAIFLSANEGNLTFPPQSNVYNFGSNATVTLVIYNHFPAEHPMHMHGHNYLVLAEGTGRWDGEIVNPANPQRRDVQILAPSFGDPTYMVVQIVQDNPGIWPFHCHIAWHVSGGLYMNLLERPDDVAKLEVPDAMAGTCETWSAWGNANQVDQIDSGL